ncbi:MAG: vanadium-dependent haloperoxidase [Methylococcales bacterium]
MNNYKSAWISILGWILLTQTAMAALPNTAQSQCMLALQAAGAKVAEVAGNDALRCINSVAKGKLAAAQVDACLATETAALKKAKAKTIAAADKSCAQLPNFGPQKAAEVNAAFVKTVDFTKVFGADVSATLKTKSSDAKAAACQVALAEEASAVAKAEVQEYSRCSKLLLKKKQASSAVDLEACFGKETAALKKAKKHATTRVAAKCATIAGVSNYPGQCINVPAGELGACLAAQAHCDSCTAVNAADHLNASGHQFKDGVATYYCGIRPQQTHSVARQWNEQILDAIRLDNPRPPVHARNLFHVSVAMYDAWAAYDAKAAPYLTEEYPAWNNPKRDRDIAISFAAYRVLVERYSEKYALGYNTSQARFAAHMDELGFDKNYTQTSGDSPAAVGNRIAAAILAHGLTDGSNEAENYKDSTYQPVNKPLIVKQAGIDLVDADSPAYKLDPNRWQPLALDKIVSQNGIPLPGNIQTSIGSQWGDVLPFAMTKTAPTDLYLDPGPQPVLGGLGDVSFKSQVLEVIELSSLLTPDVSAMIDISPASQGNSVLGTNNGVGYTSNPVTGLPYTPQLVKRGDFGRVLAEWWADGPTSETPPGHWNAIANTVADSPGFKRQIAGSGPAVSALEWDVKTYFALNGATHDAAIAAWGAKRKYDGVRPITMIRYMAKMGQSSDPALPSYHVNGLPLKTGLVELITTESSAPGQRHAHLVAKDVGGHIGDIAILAWPGSPENIKTQYSGVHWVLGTAWLPYQRATFVTPAFPGYISGHSTFSRSAAEVLAAITGSEYFPGGLYEVVIPKDAYLIHEHGPSETIKLQWASYFDAADQSGRSRLWGGIHVEADDFAGRRVGHQVGVGAFAKALRYFDGAAQ